MANSNLGKIVLATGDSFIAISDNQATTTKPHLNFAAELCQQLSCYHQFSTFGLKLAT